MASAHARGARRAGRPARAGHGCLTPSAAAGPIVAGLLSLLCAGGAAAAETPPPLPRSAPESQGIPSSAILGFVEAAEKEIDALHSLMVLRHGHVVAEGWWQPYRRDDPHILFSLTKSFTSTAVGLAAAEGRLSVDDLVLSFFPGDGPAVPGENLKAMRVRDLLTMSTGHHREEIEGFRYFGSDVSLTRAFLVLPVAHEPGTHFVYNTPASHMLSAIVQKVTGETLAEYLRPRLFEPLGIRNPLWLESDDGVSMGGFGLSVTTEDIARFGQLYLEKGVWRGERILPAEWVAEATARQVANGSATHSDWDQGYGYQFWRCRHGAYRGDGAFGQYCVVMPEQDAVVAITSGVGDMQAVLNLVWDHLLGGMRPKPLPAAGAGHERLAGKLASLALPPPQGDATSPLGPGISGATWVFPENDQGIETVRLETEGETALVARIGGLERRLSCGYGEWRRGGTLPRTSRLGGGDQEPVAAAGAWTAEDTYTVKACFYETPFCTTLGLRFVGDALFFSQEMNVGFGAAERIQLVGHRSPAP